MITPTWGRVQGEAGGGGETGCNSPQKPTCTTAGTLRLLLFGRRVCLCDPVDCSAPGFPVLPYLPEFAQTHAHLAGEETKLRQSLTLTQGRIIRK